MLNEILKKNFKDFGDNNLEMFVDKLFNLDDYAKLQCKYYEFLLNLNDKKVNKELWNYAVIGRDSANELYLNLNNPNYAFTPVLKNFLEKRLYANIYKEKAIFTDKVETNRLILAPFCNNEENIIIDEFINDKKTYEQEFMGGELSESDIDYWRKIFKTEPNRFCIKTKDTKEVVGYVEITIFKTSTSANIGYYILKKYRKRGYCMEACKALIDYTFNKKLCRYIETENQDLYKKVKVDLEFLEANCFQDNQGSNAVLKKLGFVYTGYKYKAKKAGEIYKSANYYYLPNPNFKK